MNEHKINVKFCFKLGKTLEEANAMLRCVYEDQALVHKVCVRVVHPFSRSLGKCFLQPHSGRLVTSISDESFVWKVRNLITKDRRLTVCMIADELQRKPESVQKILTQNLWMRKTSCRLVLHHLTNDQKQALLEASQDFIKTVWMQQRIS
ncbi:uncharacterized protein TNCV_4060691 [Trichonephila clavipes]|nr:uncharacterized protein TNCV_4060691 [Trichonephila clavipes]